MTTNQKKKERKEESDKTTHKRISKNVTRAGCPTRLMSWAPLCMRMMALDRMARS